ncbi:hypothetical protein F2P81_002210 [Scophthalmus maximus]|uniref:Uncharacterized protein n=1 Tax=Scophthalmus maximus TaxID=52904 RepID=A0A6A4TSJ2_SCOMX|nr:hypothetical protein F2P81_002210 [Scophthalmus maximus]
MNFQSKPDSTPVAPATRAPGTRVPRVPVALQTVRRTEVTEKSECKRTRGFSGSVATLLIRKGSTRPPESRRWSGTEGSGGTAAYLVAPHTDAKSALLRLAV